MATRNVVPRGMNEGSIGTALKKWASAYVNKILGVQTLNFDSFSELTILSGEVQKTQVLHTIDTESDGATDDLDTITGGTEGDMLMITVEDATRIVVVKHGTGNIVTPSGTDYTIDSVNKIKMFLYDGTNWVLLNE